MPATIITIEDLLSFEKRITTKLDHLSMAKEPTVRWVRYSIVKERYGFSPNKLKKMISKNQIKAKKIDGIWFYDVNDFEKDESSSD